MLSNFRSTLRLMISHHESALHHYFTDYIINNQNCTTKTDNKNAFVIPFQNIFKDLKSIVYVDYKPGL